MNGPQMLWETAPGSGPPAGRAPDQSHLWSAEEFSIRMGVCKECARKRRTRCSHPGRPRAR